MKTGISFAERAFLSVLCMGTLASLIFAAQNRLAPAERPFSFALLFLLWGLLFYAAVLLPALAVLALLGRLKRLGWAPRVGLVLLALAFLALVAFANPATLRQLLELAGPVRFRTLTPVAFAVGVASLPGLALLPSRHSRGLRLFGLGTPMLAVAAFWPDPAPPSIPAAPPPRAQSRPLDQGRRLLLVGIDGADWRYIDPLIARGDLPHLAGLRARGAWGHLKSFVPTKSPVIWTTIATGQSPTVHGVRDFTSTRMLGAGQAALPYPRLRFPAGLGFGGLYDLLGRGGTVFERPVESGARLVPAFWDIATAHGSPVAVHNWWATWPTDAILGSMVSDRVYYWRSSARGDERELSRLTYPEPLYAEIAPLVMSPDDVRYAQAQPFMDISAEEFAGIMARGYKSHVIQREFKYIYSMFETDRRIALRLMENTRSQYGAPADLLVLFRLVDLASHSSLAHSELVEDHLGADLNDVRRYAGVVSEAYRAVDRALGEILAAFGDGNVVVVSDHGFALEIHRGKGVYDHDGAPDGILLAAGPAFRPGRTDDLSIFDVMPLLAYLKGFPVAQDWPGHVPSALLDPAFAAAHPALSIASYGTRAVPTGPSSSSRMDEAVLERLRAVGYLK